MRSVWVMFAMLVLACGPSLQQQHLTTVESRRAEARERPGARQALAYAEAVHDAYRAKAYEGQPARLTADVEEAVDLLGRAAANHPQDAPTLVAWQGLLLADGERYEESFAAFERSMAIKPNYTAASNLVLVWGTAAKPDQVAQVCQATVGHLADRGELYRFIAHCMEHMNAVSEEASLAWADQATRDFYYQERGERQAEAQQAAREREAQLARERAVERDVELCISDCKQTGYACINDCYGDAACEQVCERSYQACLDACDADARYQLGL
jgi:tetratricopeptide (TPR) repeat protein